MQWNSVRHYLEGEGSDALITFMAGHSVDLGRNVDLSDAKAKAVALGWLNPATDQRTTAGILASDSCREYLFWQQRGKKLPFESGLPHLGRQIFEGKHICEIGAGMGANLMSLATSGATLCGVEPVADYVALGNIFRSREGMAPIEMRAGGAEALPFDAATLDLVLLVSAHQYFDIQIALKEIARVLRPGGELILIGGTLSAYVKDLGQRVIAGRHSLKDFLITVTNTLSYTAVGRRVIPNRSRFSTARPVYPSRSAMVSWMLSAGLTQVVEPQALDNETCFYAKRAGG